MTALPFHFHIQKILKDLHQTAMILKAIHGFEKSVLSLSELVLTDLEESVLKRELNFTVTKRVSNFDMVCAAESARSKLTPRHEYGVLLEDSMYAGKIKIFDIYN
jgi:hypothetical protein